MNARVYMRVNYARRARLFRLFASRGCVIYLAAAVWQAGGQREETGERSIESLDITAGPARARRFDPPLTLHLLYYIPMLESALARESAAFFRDVTPRFRV